MRFTVGRVIAAVSAIVLLLLALFLWHRYHIASDREITYIGDFDQFQTSLAERVRKRFTEDTADLSVIVADASYPIGTLLRPRGSLPSDSTDCIPSTTPNTYTAARLFPSYRVATNVAASGTLGARALQGLGTAGIDLKHLSEINYNIENTQLQILDDKSVEDLAASPKCREYATRHPGLRLIRGAVIGKVTFTLKVDNPGEVSANLKKFGGLEVKDDPGSSELSVSDKGVEPIVELVSEFGVSGGQTAPLQLKPVQQPVTPGIQGTHVFVQADRQDDPLHGENVVRLLKAGWTSANVESQVQKVPTGKMPDAAQIRYANSVDLANAEHGADLLRSLYPDIRVVRIGLPSPQGQIEVWLPKVPAETTNGLAPAATTKTVNAPQANPATKAQETGAQNSASSSLPGGTNATSTPNASNVGAVSRSSSLSILGTWEGTFPAKRHALAIRLHIGDVDQTKITGWFQRGESPHIALRPSSTFNGQQFTADFVFTHVRGVLRSKPDYPGSLKLHLENGTLTGRYKEGDASDDVPDGDSVTMRRVSDRPLATVQAR